jgi:predicted transcriptional regulator
MNKKYITTAEAIKLINDGCTVYYDLTDGYAAIRKKNKMTYELVVHTDEGGETVFNSGIQSLLKTLNKENIKNSLYIKD